MGIKIGALKRSIWLFHFNSGSCNNCDIEIVDCLTPRYDIERFGLKLVGSIRHADVLVVTGFVSRQSAIRLKRLWEMMPEPKFVVAVGTCACSGGIFAESYHMAGPVDKIIPVHAYIPGCPPKPEAIISGIVKLLNTLK